jgi:hypothetical protein
MLRHCPFCQKHFSPVPNNPKQTVCSDSNCQYRRRQKSRKAQLKIDPIYRETCQDDKAFWRKAKGAEYMRRYREQHPEYTTRNRCRQKARYQNRKLLLHLVKNNVALQLHPLPDQIFLVMASKSQNVDFLVKNNVAMPANMWTFQQIQSLPPVTTSIL